MLPRPNLWLALTEVNTFSQQIDEVLKKYKGSIVGLSHEGITHFVNFKHFDYDINSFIFTDRYNNSVILTRQTDAAIFTPKIIKGYYEDEKGKAYYLYRTGHRQWIRGLNTDNTAISLFKNVLKINRTTFIKYTPTLISILYNELNILKKPIPEINLELLYHLEIAPYTKVLNRDFLISLSVYEEHGYDLFFHNILVGHVTMNKQQLNLQITNYTFQQEILDALPTWGKNLNLKDT